MKYKDAGYLFLERPTQYESNLWPELRQVQGSIRAERAHSMELLWFRIRAVVDERVWRGWGFASSEATIFGP
jgi:hypothetical protein